MVTAKQKYMLDKPKIIKKGETVNHFITKDYKSEKKETTLKLENSH
jgi:hypothetical protein